MSRKQRRSNKSTGKRSKSSKSKSKSTYRSPKKNNSQKKSFPKKIPLHSEFVTFPDTNPRINMFDTSKKWYSKKAPKNKYPPKKKHGTHKNCRVSVDVFLLFSFSGRLKHWQRAEPVAFVRLWPPFQRLHVAKSMEKSMEICWVK